MAISDLFDLRGKRALVTGGSRGLGRICAETFAESGASVAIVDVNEALGEKTAERIRGYGVDSFFVKCDVADENEVEAMTAAVVDRFGGLDIGVNNAGYALMPGGAETLARSDWDRMIAVNLTGVFLCAQAQARQMAKQSPTEGKIINTASMYGLIAAGNVGYNSAKAGVIHLTHTLAVEWGRFNINVNAISPGWVLTPAMMGTSDEVKAQMRGVIPLGHIERPEDLQGAFLYLASKASNYVTGHNLVVDGGHTLSGWLRPLERELPPRVSPEEEMAEARKDLEAGSGIGMKP